MQMLQPINSIEPRTYKPGAIACWLFFIFAAVEYPIFANSTIESHMIKIEYPATKPSIKNESGKELVFCMIRKRWVVLTPEEWVRQNFLLYLIETMNYPASLIAVEKQILFGDVKKRFDMVVFDRNSKPFMIVECKEMNVPLTEPVLQQVLRYNTNLQASYLLITNGGHCAGFQTKQGQFSAIDTMPVFEN
jgi:hypothetical protein